MCACYSSLICPWDRRFEKVHQQIIKFQEVFRSFHFKSQSRRSCLMISDFYFVEIFCTCVCLELILLSLKLTCEFRAHRLQFCEYLIAREIRK